MDAEEPNLKRNIWNPFQKIESQEQALDMVKSLTVVSGLICIQFVLLAALYFFGIETDFSPPPIDEFERWFLVGFGIVLAVLAGLAGWAVYAKQWWWVTILLVLVGVFDGASRFLPLLSGEYSQPFGVFVGGVMLVVSIAALRGRIAMSRFQKAATLESLD